MGRKYVSAACSRAGPTKRHIWSFVAGYGLACPFTNSLTFAQSFTQPIAISLTFAQSQSISISQPFAVAQSITVSLTFAQSFTISLTQPVTHAFANSSWRHPQPGRPLG